MDVRADGAPGLREQVTVFLVLLSLTTLLVAQSLFEVLLANPEFLAIRLRRPTQLLELVLIFNWLPAIVLFVIWRALRGRYPRMARTLLATVYTLLFLAFFFHLHNRFVEPAFGGNWLPPLWLLPAAGLGYASVRFRESFNWGALAVLPLVLLLPVLFLVRAWGVVGQGETPPTAPRPALSAESPPSTITVVYVVLDELSLEILLDEKGQIDARRFPNFHSLAESSYWFPRAVSNADQTNYSLPVLLTGTYPTRRSPNHADYPDNLFSWLSGYEDVTAYEYVTRLCDPKHSTCLGVAADSLHEEGALFRDVGLIFLAAVLPETWDLGMPDLKRTWGPFHDSATLVRARVARFERFLALLDSTKQGVPVLLFFHHMLPHSPYVLDALGNLQEKEPDYFDARFKGNRALVEDIKGRYVQQTLFVDKQLGELLDRLRAASLYDRALLIVTADHGVSYDATAPGRALTVVDGKIPNARLLLEVPLFIKLPHQQEGKVSPVTAQHIDILPTIADALGVTLPWIAEGRSVLGDVPPHRPIVAYSGGRKRFTFDDFAALERGEGVVQPAEPAR